MPQFASQKKSCTKYSSSRALPILHLNSLIDTRYRAYAFVSVIRTLRTHTHTLRGWRRAFAELEAVAVFPEAGWTGGAVLVEVPRGPWVSMMGCGQRWTRGDGRRERGRTYRTMCRRHLVRIARRRFGCLRCASVRPCGGVRC